MIEWFIAARAAYAFAARAARAVAQIDEILTITAELVVDVLREMDAPGIALMDRLCPK